MRLARYLFLVLMLLGKPAWCGLFFEPFLNYENGAGKYEPLSTSVLPERQVKFSGTSVGLRFGAKVGAFWLGLEPSYSQGTASSDYPTLGTSGSDNYSSTRVHGLVGVDIKQRFRIWGGIGVLDQQKEVYSASEATISSNSYQAGIGFRFNKLGLHLAYLSETPNKIKDSIGGDISVSSEYSKVTMNKLLVGLSWFLK